MRGSGHRVHATLTDLLAARRPDGVLVAAPTDRHAEVARAALAAGMPVLCEKPAGLTRREVGEAGGVAADRGVAFQVAYWRRFVPAMVALHERIAAGELGEVLRSRVRSGTGLHRPRSSGTPAAGPSSTWACTNSTSSAGSPGSRWRRCRRGVPRGEPQGRARRGQRPSPARPLRRRDRSGVARAAPPGRGHGDDRGVRFGADTNDGRCSIPPRRRAHAGRARPAGGRVRRARPGRAPPRCRNGGRRAALRVAARAAEASSKRGGRDRAVTRLDQSARPIR